MSPKIEVGDKVRIVWTDSDPEWGVVNEVGTVLDIEDGVCEVAGVGEDLDDGMGWFHRVENLALFPDELEDMPEDTVVTYRENGLRARFLGASEACRRFRGAP